MLLTAPDVDEVRQLAEQGSIHEIRALEIENITLPAALELACCWWAWRESNNEIVAIIKDWSSKIPCLYKACAALNHSGFEPVTYDLLYTAPNWEICSSPLPDQLEENDWYLFLERFKRSLQQHGFSRTLALSLSKALAEMSDNIIQHSSENKNAPANGVIAYCVEDNIMTFAVADIGQGVLNSLTKNPKWHSLKTSTEALEAAVWDAATSRENEEQGNGFLQVHRSLADLNGILRFRSGNGVLCMDGRREQREGQVKFVPPLIGFQLSVCCSLNYSIK
jgi:anti-sigma regulatory factor (Ser/Thr protein kinase)